VRPDIRLYHLGLLLLLLAAFAPRTKADITVLLEEPYSYDGALAGTGHTAVYLSRVCAATPVVLRRCGPGEHGAVISRYDRIGAYDWIAIPLIPYLYAVEKPEDVPLYVDSKVVGYLRDEYRRSHLEEIAPDASTGETPKGDWVQLVGSSYDRTSYGFQIETSPEQDDALIAWFNSRPNRTIYRVVSRNCADFVREVVNFYYPKAISRGFITDLEVTTPKHAAKSLVRYSERHPDIEFTRIVFPQVPGTMRRSRPIRGVLESIFRAKKYMVVLAAFHPIVAGGVVSVYLIGDRFNPSQNAKVYDANGSPALPVTKEERKAYSEDLQAAMAVSSDKDPKHEEISWRQFEERAQIQLGESGHPVLEAPFGKEKELVEVGISRDDLGLEDAPAEIQRELIVARLRQDLAHSRAPRISGSELREDWQLLQKVNSAGQEETAKLIPGGLKAAPAPPTINAQPGPGGRGN
jgi:hypothetical protein